MSSDRIAPWLTDSRWPTVPIRLVARLGSGHTPSRSKPEYWNECTKPWITLADVWQLRNGQTDTITATKEKISLLGLANSSATIHPTGTVILSRTASVGFSAIMGHGMATSQDFATWTCGPQLVPKYLLHCLRGMTPDLKRVATGSTHKTIYMPDIETLRIPLPSVAEQHRIADFLDAETVTMSNLDSRIEIFSDLLNKRQAALLANSFSGEGSDEPDGSQRMLPLRRIMNRWIDYRGATPEKTTSGVPLVTAKNIRNGSIDLSASREYIAEDAYEAWMRRGLPRCGDVLLTTEAPLGQVAMVVDPEVALAQRIILLRTNPDFCSPEWLYWYLRSPQGQAELQLRATGSTAMGIKADRLRGVPIPLVQPALAEQRLSALRSQVDQIERLQSKLTEQRSLLAERRQTLITAAVTGQFDVSTASGRNVTDGVQA